MKKSSKFSPEVRERAVPMVQEHRTLTNMFEVMVRDYAKKLRVELNRPGF